MPELSPVALAVRQAVPALSAGVLAADLAALGADVRRLEEAGVPLLHFDVMDGCFCPALTIGPAVIAAVRTPLLKDVHLMIEEPLAKLEPFVAAGADILTVALESTRHPHRVLQALGAMRNANDPERGLLRGVTLNPGTPLEAVEPLLGETDVVTLLAVNPGWTGQSFVRATAGRAARLIEMIRRAGRDILLGIDGGITLDTVGDAVRMGADIVVAGRAVFDGGDPRANVRAMRDRMAAARRR